MSNRARATGRLRAINRADLAHGDVALIGSDLLGEAPSAGAIRDTENHGLATDTKRANRNRLKKMMDWWKTNLPEYYAVAVRDLTEDELADEDIYWWKNKQDIRYSGLDPQAVKLFLAAIKWKPEDAEGNRKLHSHTNLRRYHDAIMWGASQAKEALPAVYAEINGVNR